MSNAEHGGGNAQHYKNVNQFFSPGGAAAHKYHGPATLNSIPQAVIVRIMKQCGFESVKCGSHGDPFHNYNGLMPCAAP